MYRQWKRFLRQRAGRLAGTCAVWLCMAAASLAQEAGGAVESADALPTLHVWFEGKFSKGMEHYLNGRMRLTDTDGRAVELPARFKTRGATAQAYQMKPSFNMKLRTEDYAEEADSALLGLRSMSSWILDAMAIDRICMRNRVAFDVWNAFSRLPYDTDFGGRNGTEGRFVEVWINDVYHGIYCLSDRINRKLLGLKKVKVDKDGTATLRGLLYKNGTGDIANQEEPGYNDDFTACTVEWHNAWELTYPDDYACEAAWRPLQEAFADGTAACVKRYFFLENLADYQILVMALSLGDSWGNKNRYLSVRNVENDINDPRAEVADGRRFVLTPWDMDASLGGNSRGSYYQGNYSHWAVKDIPKTAPFPIAPVINDKEYVALLRQAWERGRVDALAPEAVNARLDAYAALFLRSGAWQRQTKHFDAQRYRPNYVEDLAGEIEGVKQWYALRFEEMDRYFGITNGTYDVRTARESGTVYSLQGIPMGGRPLPRGVYIQSGRKVIAP